MILTFVAQNLKFGGFYDDEDSFQDRWPLLLDRFNSINPKPDFLMLCEARDWDKHGYKALGRAMHDLDMDALPLAPSRSGQAVALLYRKETVGRWKNWNTGYSWEVTQSFGVASFDIGLPKPISVTPLHLSPFSKEKAVEEASLIASRAYRYGPFAVIGGDINYSPSRGLEPNYDLMRPYNIASRTEMDSDKTNGGYKPFKDVAKILEKSDYVDVAYKVYEKNNKDEYFIQHTTTKERLDQFWVSKALEPAVKSYWVVETPPEASDHKAIVFQLDTELIDTSSTWVYD
jgi:hypothetical protein